MKQRAALPQLLAKAVTACKTGTLFGLAEDIAGANLVEEPLGRRYALQRKESAGFSGVQIAHGQGECEGGVLFFFTVEVVAVEEDELLDAERAGVDAAESCFFY